MKKYIASFFIIIFLLINFSAIGDVTWPNFVAPVIPSTPGNLVIFYDDQGQQADAGYSVSGIISEIINSNVATIYYVDNTNAAMKIYVDLTNSNMKDYVDIVNSNMKAYVDLSNDNMRIYIDLINSNIFILKENLLNKNAETALGTSDDYYPTQNAVKVYVDNTNAVMKDYVDLVNSNMAEYVSLVNSNMRDFVNLTNSNMKDYVDQSNSNMKDYVDLVNSNMKNYVDNFTFANVTLSNLSNTSINKSLISATDSIYDLGSSVNNWNNGYFKTTVSSTSKPGNLSLFGNSITSFDTTGNIYVNNNSRGTFIENGIVHYRSSLRLDSSDFTNTTTLYGYTADNTNAAFIASYGSKNLNLSGTLTTAADMLGDTRAVVFNGTNTCMTSTDAALKLGNGAWTVEAWVYQADWNNPDDGVILSSYQSATAGQGVTPLRIQSSTKEFVFVTYNAASGVYAARASIAHLSPGWHHFIAVRESATKNYIYIDGTIAGSSSVTATIATAANRYLDIGCFDSIGTPDAFFSGYIQDLWIHIGVAVTPAQAQKMFARSSKLHFTLNQLGNIQQALPSEGVWISYPATVYKADGSTSAGGSIRSKYMVSKNSVTLSIDADGITNTASTAYTFYPPIAAAAGSYASGAGHGVSNTTYIGCRSYIESPPLIQVYLLNGGNWSNTGNDRFVFEMTYPWQ